ncbi:MAG: Crp/Fnr family transcriptional regulator [Elusimicrobia bacterium]|nr:Crp/Fnr family transcriptional regulator [Elusimicrobiota bacterium]
MPFTKRDAPDCRWCPHRKNCLYELLGDKPARNAWRRMRLAHRFKAGQPIFHEGAGPQGVFVVCSGNVKIFKSSRTGQQLITRIESPGDLLGHVTLLAREGPYTGTAEALNESVVCAVEEPTFRDFLSRFPQASMALLRELARDVRRGENKARDIAFKPAKGRMADILLRMGKPGRPCAVVGGIKRKDLAEMAGLTVETAVRLLRAFELKGIIGKRRKDLLLLDESRLKLIAGAAN